MIKEIPILFSTPMIMALLHKRKSQTRRLIKWPKVPDWHDWDYDPNQLERPQGGGWWPYFYHRNARIDKSGPLKCPYGQANDLLWVRESFKVEGSMSHGESVLGVRYKADGIWRQVDSPAIFKLFHSGKNEGWRPSIHMPKSAARIWLQKEFTIVEKASDISREDAIAEGLACLSKDGGQVYKYGIPDSDGLPGNDDYGWRWQDWHVDPVEAFKKLWSKVNGMETWNDWVWCNSFNILSTTGKPDLTIKAK